MKGRDNYRVIVHPDEPWFLKDGDQEGNHEKWIGVCERLIMDITRHINGIVSTDYEWDDVCEYCGEPWEEPPECCDEAIEEWEKTVAEG